MTIAEPIADAFWRAAGFAELELPRRLRRSSLVAFESLGGLEGVVDKLVGWLVVGDERWLFLHGPPGVGKSSLAAAVALQLVLQDRHPVFWSTSRLLDEARNAVGAGDGQSAVFAEASEADVLVLDDLGRELGTDWAVDRLARLIDDRYDHERLTVITSNQPLPDLGRSLGSATAQRIGELALQVHVPGPNLRIAVAAARTMESAVFRAELLDLLERTTQERRVIRTEVG